MGALRAVEYVGGGRGLHLFARGVSVGDGDLGVAALADHDPAVDCGKEGGEAEGEEEDEAVGVS